MGPPRSPLFSAAWEAAPELEVQVRADRVARLADLAQLLSGAHQLAGANERRAGLEMGEEVVAVVVGAVEGDVVARVRPVTRVDDAPAARSHDRCPLGGEDV